MRNHNAWSSVCLLMMGLAFGVALTFMFIPRVSARKAKTFSDEFRFTEVVMVPDNEHGTWNPLYLMCNNSRDLELAVEAVSSTGKQVDMGSGDMRRLGGWRR